MIRTKLILGGALIALAACQPAEIEQAPVPYTATKNLNNKGVSNFTVRSYIKHKGKAATEAKGVPCKFAGDGFRSSFVTPAILTAPDMGQLTPAASVTCTFNDKTKTVPMVAVNLTTNEIDARAMNMAAGGGLLGAVVGSISASTQKSRRDATLDRYGYNSVRVEFEATE